MAVTYRDIGKAISGRQPRGTPLAGRLGVWKGGGVVFGALGDDGEPLDGEPAAAMLCTGAAEHVKEGDAVVCLVLGGGATVVIDSIIKKEVGE